MSESMFDAVIVGGGPNGLTAAVVLGAAGLRVLLLEANDRIGGSCRTMELTLPGYLHDVCSAIHPMGVVSPAFEALHLGGEQLEWVSAPQPLAHPLDDGRVALLSRDMAETRRTLGGDGARWDAMMRPFVQRHETFFREILRPIRIPGHPLLMARFGLLGLRSCRSVVGDFSGPAARALFAGCAAHSVLPLEAAGSASFGLALAIAGHAVDWPCARGGSERIVDALAARAVASGCVIRTRARVRSMADVPASHAVLFDLTPRHLERIAGDYLSDRYRRELRAFRYGAGVFKIDYALSAPIPWRSPECFEAATVHLGGTYEEIAQAEAAVSRGEIPERPFVLVAQQSQFDRTRAPAGHHTGWAYCHVPHGSTVDMTERIERQIERFAPQFRDVVIARHVMPPEAMQRHNANLVGGDIGGGSNTLWQFLFRPVPRWNPYATSNPRLFVCSSSTPPGGGVHGMCGYLAAQTVLRRVFQKR